MNELARLLDLVPYIASRQGISIRELAAEFRVSEREIVRNLNTLFLCGLPGYTPLELMEIDFEDGFVTIRNAETLSRPRSMTASDATFALIALSHMAEQEPHLRDQISKVSATIQRQLTVPLLVEPHEDTPAVRKIESAIRLNKRLSFTYLSKYRDDQSVREVSPINLNRLQGAFYLTAYCHVSEGMRTFALERISALSVLDKESTVFHEENREIEVSIKVLKRYRKFIEFFGGEKFSTFNALWAVRAVVAAGGDVELTQPSDLRQEIARRASLALAEYTPLG